MKNIALILLFPVIFFPGFPKVDMGHLQGIWVLEGICNPKCKWMDWNGCDKIIFQQDIQGLWVMEEFFSSYDPETFEPTCEISSCPPIIQVLEIDKDFYLERTHQGMEKDTMRIDYLSKDSLWLSLDETLVFKYTRPIN